MVTPTARTFFIVPFNEGQELNYTETFLGDRKGAEDRAFKMFYGLSRLLNQGTISVEVQSKNGKKLKEIM